MLLMSASGEVWRFEADDNAQWRRVPDSADPLIMLRQYSRPVGRPALARRHHPIGDSQRHGCRRPGTSFKMRLM